MAREYAPFEAGAFPQVWRRAGRGVHSPICGVEREVANRNDAALIPAPVMPARAGTEYLLDPTEMLGGGRCAGRGVLDVAATLQRADTALEMRAIAGAGCARANAGPMNCSHGELVNALSWSGSRTDHERAEPHAATLSGVEAINPGQIGLDEVDRDEQPVDRAQMRLQIGT